MARVRIRINHVIPLIPGAGEMGLKVVEVGANDLTREQLRLLESAPTRVDDHDLPADFYLDPIQSELPDSPPIATQTVESVRSILDAAIRHGWLTN